MEMSKLDKVKKGLECLARKQEPMANPCSKCDYHDRPNFAFCVVDIATDALALLKEQEPKTVKVIGNVGVSDVRFVDCPWCAMRIHEDESQYYCGHCGQGVKWNDD